MEVIKDVETIGDCGFGPYQTRTNYGSPQGYVGGTRRQTSATNLSGGRLGVDVIELGSGSIKIDSKNKRIIINDGSDDRVLIGYQRGGF